MKHTSNRVPKNIVLVVVGWSIVLMLAVLANTAIFATEEFQEALAGFGPDIPTTTSLFITGRYLWWLFPFIALVMTLILHWRAKLQKRAQIKYAIGFAALFFLSIGLVYLLVFIINRPLMAMGGVI